jgi:hypothetical protein
MAGHSVGPRRTGSLRGYLRATRVIGGLSLLVLCGAIAWDLANAASRRGDRRHDGERWADVMVNSGTYAEIVDRHRPSTS